MAKSKPWADRINDAMEDAFLYARHWKADGRADLRPNVTTNYDLVTD